MTPIAGGNSIGTFLFLTDPLRQLVHQVHKVSALFKIGTLQLSGLSAGDIPDQIDQLAVFRSRRDIQGEGYCFSTGRRTFRNGLRSGADQKLHRSVPVDLAGVFHPDIKLTLGWNDEDTVFFQGEIAHGTGTLHRGLFYKTYLQNATVFGGSAVNAEALGVHMEGIVISGQSVGEGDLVESKQF